MSPNHKNTACGTCDIQDIKFQNGEKQRVCLTRLPRHQRFTAGLDYKTLQQLVKYEFQHAIGGSFGADMLPHDNAIFSKLENLHRCRYNSLHDDAFNVPLVVSISHRFAVRHNGRRILR